jgi:hypothetical protein
MAIANGSFGFAVLRHWLNSNKGTKCEMGFYLRPFRPWSCALFATPKTVSLWSASFWGLIPTVSCSFSSDKIILAAVLKTAHLTRVCRKNAGYFDLWSQKRFCGGAEEVNPAAAS